MSIERPALNLQPLGLLDLFGVKTGGKYPGFLTEGVAPVLDLLDWYTRGVPSVQSNLATAGLTGTFNLQSVPITSASNLPANLVVGGFVIVPTNEVWVITEAQVQWFLPAEATALSTEVIDVSYNNAGQFLADNTVGWTTGHATSQRAGRTFRNVRHFAFPGSAIGIYTLGHVSTAATLISGNLRLVRCLL